MVQRTPHHAGFLARGHHHHRQLRMQHAQVHQRIEALRTRHVEVHQQKVGIRVQVHQRIQGIHAVGLVQPHPRQQPLHRATQGFAEQGMVIGDE